MKELTAEQIVKSILDAFFAESKQLMDKSDHNVGIGKLDIARIQVQVAQSLNNVSKSIVQELSSLLSDESNA